MPEGSREEFLQKDFGKERVPENDDAVVYRNYLYQFMRMLDYNHDSRDPGAELRDIYTVTLEDAPRVLDEYYKDPSGRGKNKRGLTPIPFMRKE